MSSSSFEALVGIMARLRAPDGCPWDREQQLPDLARYIREEAEEVADAIGSGKPDAVREELGDLLFNIIHAARIAEEQGSFDIEDVIAGARDKIVRRHPHVFGDAEAKSIDDVLEHWNRIKREEKGTS
jgi:MazG family protein